VRSEDREALRAHLSTEGVNTAVHYPVPIHRVGAYADLGLAAGSLPVAEGLADRICTLPLFPGMSEDEAVRIVNGVQTFDRRQS
jgi:dTDP-4-amino-4,6-dideoxygalactose transaminase